VLIILSSPQAQQDNKPGHSIGKVSTKGDLIVIVEHGQSPSRELLERANGIRQQWIDYWGATTGHRASMTANPR